MSTRSTEAIASSRWCSLVAPTIGADTAGCDATHVQRHLGTRHATVVGDLGDAVDDLYGTNDPLYDKDIGFYLFSLPAFVAIKNWALLTLVMGALFGGFIYWVHGDIEDQRISPAAISHGSALLGLFFGVKAWSYSLDRYLLLYGDNGVVVGARFTDVNVELPVLWLLIALSIVAALAAWANLWVRTYRLPTAAIVLLFGSAFLLSGIIPAVFQRFYVGAERAGVGERPYIERNIALTLRGLQSQSDQYSKPFPAEQNPELQDTRGQQGPRLTI